MYFDLNSEQYGFQELGLVGGLWRVPPRGVPGWNSILTGGRGGCRVAIWEGAGGFINHYWGVQGHFRNPLESLEEHLQDTVGPLLEHFGDTLETL